MALVEPAELTDYHRSRRQLEGLVLYSVMAWARDSNRAKEALECPPARTPFGRIRKAIRQGTLQAAVEATRIGDYRKRTRAIIAAVELDPRTVDVATLASCIGLKSARLVILHSRSDAQCAVLDRHVLAYLRELGYDVPERDTPSSPRRYKQLEQIVLNECQRQGRNPAELDLTTWVERSRREQQ
jgi:hypothetical protein